MRKPIDVIRGWIVFDARKEIHEVKMEHYRLMSLWRNSDWEKRKEIDKLISENIAKFDKIEEKYFGKKE